MIHAFGYGAEEMYVKHCIRQQRDVENAASIENGVFILIHEKDCVGHIVEQISFYKNMDERSCCC